MNSKSLAIVAVTALSLMSLMPAAKAGLTSNGTQLNALSPNGMQLNALSPNGIRMNGISANGTQLDQTGLTLSSAEFSAIQVEEGRLIGIK